MYSAAMKVLSVSLTCHTLSQMLEFNSVSECINFAVHRWYTLVWKCEYSALSHEYAVWISECNKHGVNIQDAGNGNCLLVLHMPSFSFVPACFGMEFYFSVV